MRWVTFLLFAPFSAAAAGDQADFFELRVRPVFARYCHACHTRSKLGGLEITSREALLRGGKRGAALLPGNPTESLLIRAVRKNGDLKMPPQGRLTDREIEDLELWIKAGAPWPEILGTAPPHHRADPDGLIPFLRHPRLSDARQREQVELLAEINREHQRRREGDAELEASIQAMEMAYRMQAEATDAFDLRRERPETHARYGDSNFGRGCLLARRLAERGVRTVQVFFEASDPWDHHADIMMHQKLAAMADPAIAALLDDLRVSGLLAETLVLVGSEFGRTPTAEISVRQFLQNGRDHNPYGFTVLLAGGGVRGGYAHGATDEWGWRAVDKPVHVHDLHATMLHLLGFDHTRLTYHYSGRDFRLTDVEGNVVKEVLA